MVRVAIDVPAFAAGGEDGFDYLVPAGFGDSLAPGAWVRVPWGRGERIGLVLGCVDEPAVDRSRLRPVSERLAIERDAPPAWRALVAFAARYYHRSAGEVAVPSLPKLFRTAGRASSRGTPIERARRRFDAASARQDPSAGGPTRPAPTSEQQSALDALQSSEGFAVWLLHGVTGSGKTEVYLSWLASVLARDAKSQVLLMVPEIALTPQLRAQVSARFPQMAVALLHSDMPDGERAAHWLAAAEGRARIVVGTRLAVLAPLPRLAAIVVDEEHDPSYRQQEGVRYSARDLAVAAGSLWKVPVLLGSATPSMESWLAARRGRYRMLSLGKRVGDAPLPAPEIVDLRGQTLKHDLAPAAIAAIEATLADGAQALVFINRRGYAPVLNCRQCGWLSGCPNCSAWRVLHRLDAVRGSGAGSAGRGSGSVGTRYRLVCHHCGAESPVPRHCPDCGAADLQGLGRGTQRLEEGLAELFPSARILRLDRDVARRRGAAQRVLEAAHAGTVDLLVGTQMLAKGHDFRRLALVVVVDSDGGLFAADYRAPERLFATLMQVAGRAGRDARASRVLVQTRHPDHPLFARLARHDYAGFADGVLEERRAAGLPPWRHHVLLRAEANRQDEVLDFLARARDAGTDLAGDGEVALLDPVPMALARVAERERGQLLVEADQRAALHAFVHAWQPRLHALKTPATLRWALDVDPAEI